MGRPVSVTVCGIANLILGVLGVCGGLAGIAQILLMPFYEQMMQNMPGNPMADPSMFDLGPGMTAYTIVAGILSLGLGVAALFSGVGLLMVREWARKLAIFYAWATIVMFIIVTIVQYAFILPEMLPKVEAGLAEVPGAGMMQHWVIIASSIAGTMFGAAYSVVYPGVMIYLMKRPDTIKAFQIANWDGSLETQPGNQGR